MGVVGHLGARNKSFLRLVVTEAAPDESAPHGGGEKERRGEETGST